MQVLDVCIQCVWDVCQPFSLCDLHREWSQVLHKDAGVKRANHRSSSEQNESMEPDHAAHFTARGDDQITRQTPIPLQVFESTDDTIMLVKSRKSISYTLVCFIQNKDYYFV